jgi:HK97 family phage major capsid protein
MSTAELLRQAEQEAEKLSSIKLDAQQERRFAFLLSKCSNLRALLAEAPEKRPATSTTDAEERAMLRRFLTHKPTDPNKRNPTYRTYAPMNTTESGTGAGGFWIPQGFIKVLAESQMSAGPLYAGSPLLTDVTITETGPARLPTLNDTASTGFEHTENNTESDGTYNGLISNVTTALRSWSSGFVQYSLELSTDVASFDSFTKILARSLGARIGRIQNSSFLSSLMTKLAANSSAGAQSSLTSGVVGYDDVTDLVASVNAAYRSNAAFLMNSDTARLVAQIDTSDAGYLPFRSVLAAKPTLLDYPVYISDFCDDITTGDKPILFGDFSTIYSRATDFEIQVFTERFIESGSYALVARRRSDIQYAIQSTADSAIKYLTIS